MSTLSCGGQFGNKAAGEIIGAVLFGSDPFPVCHDPSTLYYYTLYGTVVKRTVSTIGGSGWWLLQRACSTEIQFAGHPRHPYNARTCFYIDRLFGNDETAHSVVYNRVSTKADRSPFLCALAIHGNC